MIADEHTMSKLVLHVLENSIKVAEVKFQEDRTEAAL